jgi:ribonuclease P protein subunit POP4
MKAEKLIKSELMGQTIKVISSRNLANRGLQGTIVDETKNTLVIETAKGKKRLIKQDCVFELEVGKQKIRIKGIILAKRPEERIKIKLK